MFLLKTNTLVVKALRQTFNGAYPVHDLRDMHVSLEFPVEKLNYPCLWVDFEPSTELLNAGIGHVEYAPWTNGSTNMVERWRFQGVISITAVAFSSAVRDKMVDELMRVCAFARSDPAATPFRAAIENNDLIGLSISWDKLGIGQKSASSGTPWGSDEWLYEATVRLNAIGEIVSDPTTGDLVPLASVVVYPRIEGDPDLPGGDGWS